MLNLIIKWGAWSTLTVCSALRVELFRTTHSLNHLVGLIHSLNYPRPTLLKAIFLLMLSKCYCHTWKINSIGLILSGASKTEQGWLQKNLSNVINTRWILLPLLRQKRHPRFTAWVGPCSSIERSYSWRIWYWVRHQKDTGSLMLRMQFTRFWCTASRLFGASSMAEGPLP